MTERSTPSDDRRRTHWRHLGRLVAAHVVNLREADLIDADAAATLLAALDGVVDATPPAVPLPALIAEFDDRLDALTPVGVAGSARVGRGAAEFVAAVTRLALRDRLLVLAAAGDDLRSALLTLAGEQTVTLLPVAIGGQPAQPSTLAHLLGGVISPLGRSARRLAATYAEVNRSPLGAGALASTGWSLDRARAAELLGFDDVVTNTFDAVAAIDHLASCGAVAGSIASPIGRFFDEVLRWLRVDPGSFRLTDDSILRLPDLPQLRAPTRVASLALEARRVQSEAGALDRLLTAVDYAPIVDAADPLLDATLDLLDDARRLVEAATHLLTSGLTVNRAALANRAGRAHATSSDLADVLMIEEGIDPGAARSIAALAVARVMDQGIEMSGLTPEIIDGAAMIVLGRELKVEFEAISRYLAPRRFVERRAALGAPAPAATRDWMEEERTILAADGAWRTTTAARIGDAESALRGMVDDRSP